MKKILFILLLFPCWVFAQQAQPVNPVQVPQTTLYNEPSTGTRWWYNGATLGWYPLFPYSPPNTVLTGLSMSVVSSTLTVHTGTWRINNQVYTLGSNTNFTLQARDSVYSRYETVYATGVNNGIGIKVGVLSPTPIQPSVGADTLIVGAVLITPTQTTIIPPGPANEFVFSQPLVQQSYANPWTRTVRTDTLKIGGHYILPPIDGTSGQVIQTDGAGNLFWSNQAIYLPLYPITISANNIGVDTAGSTRGLVTHTALLDTLRKNAAHFNPKQFIIGNDTINLNPRDTTTVDSVLGMKNGRLYKGKSTGGGTGNTIYTANDSLINDRVVSFVTHQLVLGDQTNLGAYLNINPKQAFPNINGYVTDIDLNTFTSLSLNREVAQLQHSDYANNRQGSFVASEIIAGLDTTEHLVMNLSNKGIINGVDFDSHGAMVITDGIASKGITYANNYGANFTDRSLVDKRYVDSVASAGGSGITALTGDVTASGSGSVAATLATVNSNVGSFGDATHVGAFTVNGKGLITAASSTAITFPVTASNSVAFTNKTGNISQWTNDSGYALLTGTQTFTNVNTFNSYLSLLAQSSVSGDGTHAGLAYSSTTHGFRYQPITGEGSAYTIVSTLGSAASDTIAKKGTFAMLSDIPAGVAGANPTATAGTSAVNGSATTFMRSDAAPKVDSSVFRTVANSYSLSGLQTKFNGYVPTSTTVAGFPLSGNVTLAALTATDATLTFSGSYTGATARTVGLNLGNANTWTAAPSVSLTGVTTSTTTDGLVLLNPTVTTSGTTQYNSPVIRWTGHAWNTTSVAADNQGDYIMGLNMDRSNPAFPSPQWILANRLSASGSGAYSTVMKWDYYNGLSITGVASVSGNIISTGGDIKVNSGSVKSFNYSVPTSGNTMFVGNGNNFSAAGTNVNMAGSTATNSSGQFNAVSITPTYNQTSTAAATDLLINRTQTAVGSGAQLLIDAQVAGTSKFKVDNTGLTTVQGNLVLGTIGNELKIAEGSGGFTGQTTLVSGTKAVTITGVTTGSRAFVTLVTQGGTVTTTTAYGAVCTSNTLTITALTNAGTTDTTDTSILNYFIVN